jgi:hypothetical protein
MRELLAEFAIVRAGKACLLPRPEPPEPSPAALAVHRALDRMAERFKAAERERQAARRAAKLERRAKRRLEAAQRAEPEVASDVMMGCNSYKRHRPPQPLPEPPQPVPLAGLRF